ncbi:MAG: hypothetical protein ACI9QD_000352 [Thermoproteota archaeon]|jgi:hypothetical protein
MKKTTMMKYISLFLLAIGFSSLALANKDRSDFVTVYKQGTSKCSSKFRDPKYLSRSKYFSSYSLCMDAVESKCTSNSKKYWSVSKCKTRKKYYTVSSGKCVSKRSENDKVPSGEFKSSSKCKKSLKGDKLYYVSTKSSGKSSCKKIYENELSEKSLSKSDTFSSKSGCKKELKKDTIYYIKMSKSGSKGSCKKTSKSKLEDGVASYDSKSSCKSALNKDKVYIIVAGTRKAKCSKAMKSNLDSGVESFSSRKSCKAELKKDQVYIIVAGKTKSKCNKAVKSQLDSGAKSYVDRKSCKAQLKSGSVYIIVEGKRKSKCKKAQKDQLEAGVKSFADRKLCKAEIKRDQVYVIIAGRRKAKCKKSVKSNLQAGEESYADKSSCREALKQDQKYVFETSLKGKVKCVKAIEKSLKSGQQSFNTKKFCKDELKKQRIYFISESNKCSKGYSFNQKGETFATKSLCHNKIDGKEVAYYIDGSRCKSDDKAEIQKSGVTSYSDKTSCQEAAARESGGKGYIVERGSCVKVHASVQSSETIYVSKSDCKKSIGGTKVFYISASGKCKKDYPADVPSGTNTYDSRTACKEVAAGDSIYYVKDGSCKKGYAGQVSEEGETYNDQISCEAGLKTAGTSDNENLLDGDPSGLVGGINSGVNSLDDINSSSTPDKGLDGVTASTDIEVKDTKEQACVKKAGFIWTGARCKRDKTEDGKYARQEARCLRKQSKGYFWKDNKCSRDKNSKDKAKAARLEAGCKKKFDKGFEWNAGTNKCKKNHTKAKSLRLAKKEEKCKKKSDKGFEWKNNKCRRNKDARKANRLAKKQKRCEKKAVKGYVWADGKCKKDKSKVLKVFYARSKKCRRAKGNKAKRIIERAKYKSFKSDSACKSFLASGVVPAGSGVESVAEGLGTDSASLTAAASAADGARGIAQADENKKISAFKLGKKSCKSVNTAQKSVDNRSVFSSLAACKVQLGDSIDNNGVFKLGANRCTRVSGRSAKKYLDGAGNLKSHYSDKYFTARPSCEDKLAVKNKESGKKAIFVLQSNRCRTVYSKRARYNTTTKFKTIEECSLKVVSNTKSVANLDFNSSGNESLGQGFSDDGSLSNTQDSKSVAPVIQGAPSGTVTGTGGNATTVGPTLPGTSAKTTEMINGVSQNGTQEFYEDTNKVLEETDTKGLEEEEKDGFFARNFGIGKKPKTKEACEAKEGMYWSDTREKCKKKKKFKTAAKCQKHIKKAFRRIASGRYNVSAAKSYLNRKSCSPSDMAKADQDAKGESTNL